MAEWLSGVNGSKSLGLSSWCEVRMDLVHECRASYSHSRSFAPASEGWRRARSVTTFCGAQILGCHCCFSSVSPNQHQVWITLLSATAAEDEAASLGTYRGRLNIALRPNEFFSVWRFVLDQRLYHSWEMRANTFATDIRKPICQCQGVFSGITWRQ